MMGRVKSWEVTDEFWKRVEPLVPMRVRTTDKTYRRKVGGGRKQKDARLVFEAIVYVLRTGCQWKVLPFERFGSASTIHQRYLDWERAGLFEALWKKGLGEYDDLAGIAMALAEHRRGDDESPDGTEIRGGEPDGSGKKMEASDTCWWTGVASRYRSS